MSKSYILSRMDWAKAYRDYEALKVGNENLLLDSNNFNKFGVGFGGSIPKISPNQISENLKTNNATLISITGGTNVLKTTPNINYSGKETITYSFWYENLSDKPIFFRMNGFVGSERAIEIQPKGYGRLALTGSMRRDFDWFQHQIVTKDVNDEVKVLLYSSKLEIGREATPYTPSPQDINASPFTVKLAQDYYQQQQEIDELRNAILQLGGK